MLGVHAHIKDGDEKKPAEDIKNNWFSSRNFFLDSIKDKGIFALSSRHKNRIPAMSNRIGKITE